jgi:hypothetical protein
VKRVLIASASALPLALSLGGCYWLASYADLTSGLGDAGSSPAPGVDSGPGVDAGPGPGVDAAGIDAAAPVPTRFCPSDAGPYSYCMDFDELEAGAPAIGSYEAEAAIVSGTYVSPPNALSVNLYGMGSNGGYNVPFSSFQPTVSRMEFDVLAPTINQWVTTLAVSLQTAGAGETLNVVMSPQGEFQVQEYFALEDGGNEQDGHQTPPLDGGVDAGAWHHVVLTLTTDPSRPQGQQYTSGLTVDGQVLEDQVPLGLTWAQGTPTLSVGVAYGGGSGPQFFFDNVRVDFTL